MIIKRLKHNCNGFTLVELLVVTVIMGLVIISMLSLFTNTQQNANTQEDVANTQQNLRVAMDFMVRDIQMAGFLIPASLTDTAVGNSPDSLDPTNPTIVLTLRTASTTQDIARLVSTVPVENSPTTDYKFEVATEEMAELFEDGDRVRLIRSPDHNQTQDVRFTVHSVDAEATPPWVKLIGSENSVVYTQADLLVKVRKSDLPPIVPHPAVIDYRLNEINNVTLLQRNDGNGFQTVAENIASVDLVYDAKSIRVTITGTAFDLTDKQIKNRRITRLISLKNNQ